MASGGGIAKLLGDNIINGGGEKVSVSAKYVGLYFSAHWCPPCRGFTPVLKEFYLKKKEEAKGLEIVFVSSDRDEASFKEYFGEMPWLALAFVEREKKAEVSNKFGVNGIPYFILLDGATGEVITKDGRAGVMNKADAFPDWSDGRKEN